MRAALIAIALLTGMGAAQAQTAAERRTCYEDAIRLCGVKRGVEPSALAKIGIGLCMMAHVGSVSPACRAVFAAHGL
jgi:hypothetical protein